MIRLCISIVFYRNEVEAYGETLRALAAAVGYARRQAAFSELHTTLAIIDNDSVRCSAPEPAAMLSDAQTSVFDAIRHEVAPSNRGYGVGHNLALKAVESDYHLILNPDLVVAEEAIAEALVYMGEHPEVSLVAPDASDAAEGRLYLCKRYPSVLVLFLRAFCPHTQKKPFARYLADYEMRDIYEGPLQATPVPLVSGCCMFARTRHLRAVGGFCPGYFMYFEDYDLSLRIARHGRIHLLPAFRVVHHGGGASSKGMAHILMFIRSGLTFFNRHGWRLL